MSSFKLSRLKLWDKVILKGKFLLRYLIRLIENFKGIRRNSLYREDKHKLILKYIDNKVF